MVRCRSSLARGGTMRCSRSEAARLTGALLAAALALTGCLIDADHRCGDNQRLVNALCVCAENYVLQAGSCVPAAAQNEPDGGIGVACMPGSMRCADPEFSLCQTALSGRSYCTSTGCTSSAQCGPGFVCATGASPSYCRRLYEGQKQTCASTADCARFDAKYCVVQLGQCIVRDCQADSCDPDWTCFDLSQLLAGEPKVCAPNELIPK
jgi:hypothetical protein